MKEAFFNLFRGLERAHGRFTIQRVNTAKHGKQEGRAETVREPVTSALWDKHLKGEQGLGIIPIRDDATIFFGAIDIDKNDIDHVALEEKITALELPLVVARSKSGGAHCCLFGNEPLPARLARDRLTEWAALLGYAGAEVFPKQVKLASDQDIGNWLNMPYFDAEKTTRYAIADGKKLSAKEFIDYAMALRVSVLNLEELQRKPSPELEGGPPCLQTLVAQGFPEGTRNNGLYNLAVYARLRYGDNWPQHVEQYNHAYMHPPLQAREVVVLEKSISKKKYFYKCSEAPINAVCNKKLCVQRQYGVGQETDDAINIVLGSFTRRTTDPVTWIVDVDGYRIEMDTEDLMEQPRFRKKCVEKISLLPPRVPPVRWEATIREKVRLAEIQEAPMDATPTGQFLLHLKDFCTGKLQGKTKEDLLRGKPWTEKECTYFRSPDLLAYLDRLRFRAFTERKIWSILREIGGHTQFSIKGVCVQCWWVPEFTVQQEAFEVPEIPKEEF